MVKSITFTAKSYYDGTPKEQLADWTKDMDRDDIISVTLHENESITLFYWG